jgi:hypothetical protein
VDARQHALEFARGNNHGIDIFAVEQGAIVLINRVLSARRALERFRTG